MKRFKQAPDASIVARIPLHRGSNTSDVKEQKYWQSVRANPNRTAREIRGKLREIDRRLANVEEHYVSSNPRLDAEIERLR